MSGIPKVGITMPILNQPYEKVRRPGGARREAGRVARRFDLASGVPDG